AQTELLSVTQQRQELTSVITAGHNHDFLDARANQGFDWVEDHRFVVDGQQVFVRDAGQRMQARSGAAGENDALHTNTATRCLAAVSSGNSSRNVGLRWSRSERIGDAFGHAIARSGSSHATARVSEPS